MRAVYQNTQLQVVDLPEPEPGPGQVLVEVLRCVCGSDLHLRHHCDHMKALMTRIGHAKHFPGSEDAVVFGHEFCCEVLEYGPRLRSQDQAERLWSPNRFCALVTKWILRGCRLALPEPTPSACCCRRRQCCPS